jgi:hypothetical protein
MTITTDVVDDETNGFDYDAELEAVESLEIAVKHAEYAAYWRGRITEIADAYDAEDRKLLAKLEALRERREFEVGKLTKKLAFHEAHIAEYHRSVLRANPKRKTLDLVHGSSRATVPAKPKVWFTPEGMDEHMAWVRAYHPELLRPPLISDVRRVVSGDESGKVFDIDTGEIVPGVVAQVPEPYYAFEPDGGGPY